ncbi:recombination regulator RecX [Deinococcus hohokamensis]|uniref:Regulatory protein RecX n=1 Tax=Deinococcus hohokamensis TaxID=309883 RepID=A0ABV9I515_9DEIO
MHRPRRRSPRREAEEGAEPPAGPRTPPTPEEAREALLAYAFRALGARALTETELRTKLQRRSDDEALVAEVLGRVRELGYQDDAQVARAENARRGVGTHRVRQTLKRRGVEETLITDTLAGRDPDQEAEDLRSMLERRWASFARKRDPAASAYAFLARRGYPGSLIWPAIREQQAQAGEEPSEWPPEDD